MCSIIGSSSRVVDTEGFTIDELCGNVATSDDTLSIAFVNAKAGTAEPWLTLSYDEWICVRKGKITFSQEGKPDLVVSAGETVKIISGTRFKPSFPEDTEYIPVCKPAFRPDRCLREDTNDSGKMVAAKLKKLHTKKEEEEYPDPSTSDENKESSPEVLYHMTTVKEWNAAKSKGVAYYPKTFAVDGHYTHATGVPSRLLTTANHFYQDVPGDWVCLQFTRSSLKDVGIFVRDEKALPVGDKPVSSDWLKKKWICPHVVGGIPVNVVEKEYAMLRKGTEFTGIDGLC
eukprot:g3760.t1